MHWLDFFPSDKFIISGDIGGRLLSTSTPFMIKMDVAPMLAITWVVAFVSALRYCSIGFPIDCHTPWRAWRWCGLFHIITVMSSSLMDDVFPKQAYKQEQNDYIYVLYHNALPLTIRCSALMARQFYAYPLCTDCTPPQWIVVHSCGWLNLGSSTIWMDMLLTCTRLQHQNNNGNTPSSCCGPYRCWRNQGFCAAVVAYLWGTVQCRRHKGPLPQ